MLEEKRIRGVPVRWLSIGTIVLVVACGVLAFGSCVTYSNAVSTSAANVSAVEKALDAKIKAQEQDLDQLRTQQNASAEKLGQQERTIIALRNDADKLTKQVAALEADRTRLQMQALLLKASGKVVRAITHLSADSPGLATRDLATAIDALDQAMVLASGDKKAALDEIRAGLAELRQSIEAKAYPLATLEILSDKIEELVGK